MLRLIPDGTNINFMKSRMVALVLSVVLMIGSLGLFATNGLNLGIDFKGGISMEVGTEKAVDMAFIRSTLGDLGLGEIKVQEHGKPENAMIRIERQAGDEGAQSEAILEIQTSLDAAYLGRVFDKEAQAEAFLKLKSLIDKAFPSTGIVDDAQNETIQSIKSTLDQIPLSIAEEGIEKQKLVMTKLKVALDDALKNFAGTEEQRKDVKEGITEAYAAAFHGLHYRSTSSIGPTVSGELAVDGTKAIVFAVIAVMIYIWLRFEWQFGLGAVLALTHDVILTIGFFAVTRLEFNLSIIAALLTIVGYSLNDTVVVYDRVRENIRKFRKRGVEDVINFSLNQTLSRTVMTSLTTLIALFSLYFFGGPAVSGFTAAMIWGVFVGTYSSIFVAAPMLLFFKVESSHFTNDEDSTSKEKA